MTERVWRERGLRDAVVAGDDKAWNALYADEYATLEAYVLWRCASLRAFADDVIQETWLTAVRRIRRFDPERGSARQWLCGIAANVLRNTFRSRKRSRISESLNGTEASMDSTVLDRERAERIAFALSAISDRYESALRMKYLERMTVADIASATGETEKAIESLLTRARAAFREVYGND